MLREEFQIDIRVLGIADSKRMLTSESGIDLESWKDAWAANQQPADLSAFGKQLTQGYIPNLAIVDCTARCDFVAMTCVFCRRLVV
jgi:aspartokinase/homoserine dehydrogenase 1